MSTGTRSQGAVESSLLSSKGGSPVLKAWRSTIADLNSLLRAEDFTPLDSRANYELLNSMKNYPDGVPHFLILVEWAFHASNLAWVNRQLAPAAAAVSTARSLESCQRFWTESFDLTCQIVRDIIARKSTMAIVVLSADEREKYAHWSLVQMGQNPTATPGRRYSDNTSELAKKSQAPTELADYFDYRDQKTREQGRRPVHVKAVSQAETPDEKSEIPTDLIDFLDYSTYQAVMASGADGAGEGEEAAQATRAPIDVNNLFESIETPRNSHGPNEFDESDWECVPTPLGSSDCGDDRNGLMGTEAYEEIEAPFDRESSKHEGDKLGMKAMFQHIQAQMASMWDTADRETDHGVEDNGKWPSGESEEQATREGDMTSSECDGGVQPDRLVEEWKQYFDADDGAGLERWQRLLADLGQEGDFSSMTKCKKALKPLWVNVGQFLGAEQRPRDVILFGSERQLAAYTREHGGKISAAAARGDGPSPLTHMLAKVKRHHK